MSLKSKIYAIADADAESPSNDELNYQVKRSRFPAFQIYGDLSSLQLGSGMKLRLIVKLIFLDNELPEKLFALSANKN